MASTGSESVSRRDKFSALLDVARFNPTFTVMIVCLGFAAAVLEGVGLSFIMPIIEIVQLDDPTAEADGLMAVFVQAYETLGIPFTLGYVVLGVTAVMTIRYTTSFVVGWFREALRTYYIRELQLRAYRNALSARVSYYDQEGSDDILNAIITQTFYAGRVIQRVVKLLERIFLSIVYLGIAFIIAPLLTIFAIVVLGFLTFALRNVIEPGYSVGDQVADANERRQEAAQAGTQGIRDVRIFGLGNELLQDFTRALNKYTNARIILRRNEAAIENFYQLGVAVSIFVLIYLGLTFANLSIGALGVFLFAMFQLGPQVSQVNRLFYQIENDLPHLVRTQRFITDLERRTEPNDPTRTTSEVVQCVEFDDVHFSYNNEKQILRGINFKVEKEEFVAFVGQSGAGKSTIVSLLARLYEPDAGEIRANEVPIDEMDIDTWRDKVAIVRQNPYIFNDTLKYNLTIGNRDATQTELDQVCEIAKVNEFLEELPNGYQTTLGDDGVRLSGGQKQRIALARALLEDADVLVLDEATSDLDSGLEQQVQQGIETMDRDYAIIAIAHRLSTIENADRIYTVECGKIIEEGTHGDLINEEGKYADLYAIQS